MVVAIAGAHGKIAMRLTPLLTGAGHQVSGLIRDPAQADAIAAQDATPAVCDLENAEAAEIAEVIAGADAVVFAAGAGAGSGAERKLTMDRDGAIKLLQAARERDVPRFVIVSSVGAENPPPGDEVFSVYLQAKAAADDAVKASDREWTIVRPGRLTDDPGTGQARIDTTPFRGEVSREDVAAVIARVLEDPRSSHHVLYVNGGEQPIEQALESAVTR
jgi:nucleoside-diphosphate-sugar epimerase